MTIGQTAIRSRCLKRTLNITHCIFEAHIQHSRNSIECDDHRNTITCKLQAPKTISIKHSGIMTSHKPWFERTAVLLASTVLNIYKTIIIRPSGNMAASSRDRQQTANCYEAIYYSCLNRAGALKFVFAATIVVTLCDAHLTTLSVRKINVIFPKAEGHKREIAKIPPYQTSPRFNFIVLFVFNSFQLLLIFVLILIHVCHVWLSS